MNIDITVYLKGFHGDCSATYIVGDATPETAKLREVSEKALMVRSHKANFTCSHLVFRSASRPRCPTGPSLSLATRSRLTSRSKDCAYSPTLSVTASEACSTPHRALSSTAPFSQTNRYIFNVKNRFPGVILPGLVFTVEPVICAGSTNFKYVAKCDPRLTLT